MYKAREVLPAVVLSILTAAGCASVPRATQHGRVLDLWSNISTKSYIRVRGIGAAQVHGVTRTRAESRDAALVDARYQLLALIRGVRVSGGVTVEQLMERDSLVRALANNMVAGGDEVLTEWTKDGGCVVTLELKRSTVERLIKRKTEYDETLENHIAQDIGEINRLNHKLNSLADHDIIHADLDEVYVVERKEEMLKEAEAGKGSYSIAEIQAIDPKRLARVMREMRETGGGHYFWQHFSPPEDAIRHDFAISAPTWEGSRKMAERLGAACDKDIHSQGCYKWLESKEPDLYLSASKRATVPCLNANIQYVEKEPWGETEYFDYMHYPVSANKAFNEDCVNRLALTEPERAAQSAQPVGTAMTEQGMLDDIQSRMLGHQ